MSCESCPVSGNFFKRLGARRCLASLAQCLVSLGSFIKLITLLNKVKYVGVNKRLVTKSKETVIKSVQNKNNNL